MNTPASPRIPLADAIIGALPFDGRWLVRNSPAQRVPSHGTTLFGVTYAMDFIAVDERGRTAPTTSWRTYFSTESPETFYAFGRPVLAPVAGRIVARHDGEEDHAARRSQLALVPYALGQAARVREGTGAIAGNHLVIQLPQGKGYVGVVHLRRGSMRVEVGDHVTVGQQLAECGNSGNSTQPHIHLQAMDSLDLNAARGLPLLFERFQQQGPGSRETVRREASIPDENAVVSPVD